MARYDYRRDAILGPVLAHWLQARGNRPMPRRADIAPKAISQQLSHVQLLDVEDGGKKFRFRVVGSTFTEIFGREVTGRYMHEELAENVYRVASAILMTVCETRKPQFQRNDYITPKGVKVISNRIFLPLSEDGVSVSMLLVAASFESPYAIKGTLSGATMPENNYQEEIDTGFTPGVPEL